MAAYDDTLFDPPAPLAIVTLRDPASEKALPHVPMLIDSGADVTLLPAISVAQLGLDADAEGKYELMGFDGNITVSQAVRVDLLFLGRNFKGRFLLTDQECGILGRDIINHLSLLMDGPNLTWDEYKKLA